MAYMMEYIDNQNRQSNATQAAYDMAYMLEYINDETAGKTGKAMRHKPPTTWPICWNILMMKQLEHAKTSHLQDGLYAGLLIIKQLQKVDTSCLRHALHAGIY